MLTREARQVWTDFCTAATPEQLQQVLQRENKRAETWAGCGTPEYNALQVVRMVEREQEVRAIAVEPS